MVVLLAAPVVLAACVGGVVPGSGDGVLDNELVGLDIDLVQAIEDPESIDHPCLRTDLIGCPDNPAPKGTVFSLDGYEVEYHGTNIHRWSESKPNPFAGSPSFSDDPVEDEYEDSYIYAYTLFRVSNTSASFVDLTGDEDDGLDLEVGSAVETSYDLSPCSGQGRWIMGSGGVYLTPGQESYVLFCSVSIALPGYHSGQAQMGPGQLGIDLRLPNCGWYCGVDLEPAGQAFDIAILDDVEILFEDDYQKRLFGGQGRDEATDWLRSPEAVSSLSEAG